MSSVYREDGTGTANTAAQPATVTSMQQQEILTYINQARSKPCVCGTTTYPAVPALTLDGHLQLFQSYGPRWVATLGSGNA